VGVRDKPQPRLLQQILRDLASPREAQQKREQTSVEGAVGRVERRCVSCTEPANERQLGFPVQFGPRFSQIPIPQSPIPNPQSPS